jgi:hypothetical protein
MPPGSQIPSHGRCLFMHLRGIAISEHYPRAYTFHDLIALAGDSHNVLEHPSGRVQGNSLPSHWLVPHNFEINSRNNPISLSSDVEINLRDPLFKVKRSARVAKRPRRCGYVS